MAKKSDKLTEEVKESTTVDTQKNDTKKKRDEKKTKTKDKEYETYNDSTAYLDSDLYMWNSKLEYYKRKIEATGDLTDSDKEEIKHILKQVSEYTAQKSLMLYKQSEENVSKINNQKKAERSQELAKMSREASVKAKMTLNTITTALATSSLEPSSFIRQITNVQGLIAGIMIGLTKISGNVAKTGVAGLKAKTKIKQIEREIDDAMKSLNETEEHLTNKGKEIIDMGTEV